MRFLFSRHDGGPDSGVTGFWLLEWKAGVSVVLLRFEPGSRREVFHSHAFAALTWWLRGEVDELHADGRRLRWAPSLRPKWTPRSCCHRILPRRRSGALSVRGPWKRTWLEYHAGRDETRRLTNGRRVVEAS